MRFGFPLCLNTGRAPAAPAAGGSYRYIRFRTTVTPDGTGVALAEFAAAVSAAGATVFSGKTASATSSFDGTTLPANAIDGNTGTIWASDFSNTWPQDLIIDMGVGNAFAPFEFRVTARASPVNQSPGSFTIAGSNDASVYTTLVTQTGQTFTTSETKTYTV